MKLCFALLASACMLMAGCASIGASSDTDVRANRHMALADSLEMASRLMDATLEYRAVAEHYPESNAYSGAVRKVALLYMNPDNPAFSDSLALHWFSVYLSLPIKWPERESARMHMATLGRIELLQSETARQVKVADSLLAVIRRQDGQIAGQTQQIQALQAELKQVRDELKRLKDVDVRLSKSRRKETAEP